MLMSYGGAAEEVLGTPGIEPQNGRIMEYPNIHSQAVLSGPPPAEKGECGLAASLDRKKTDAAKPPCDAARSPYEE